MVQAVVNETRPVDYALVLALQQEVRDLKAQLRRCAEGLGTPMGPLADAPEAARAGPDPDPAALQQQQQQLVRLRGDNDALRREVADLRARAAAAPPHTAGAQSAAAAAAAAAEAETHAAAAEGAYRLLAQRDASTWQHVEAVQATMRRFFRFQIEEDDMRAQVGGGRRAIPRTPFSLSLTPLPHPCPAQVGEAALPSPAPLSLFLSMKARPTRSILSPPLAAFVQVVKAIAATG